jgi:aryl-alcohol dehydrogenase-like predicted oxidoreductase
MNAGVEVSRFTPGAMMFGARDNADQEGSIRIIHGALRERITFIGLW